ncbi:hypothetical protein GCM10027589_33120 [Actinocorallia lasiicapitis]
MDDPQWTRRDPGTTSRDVPGPRPEPLVRLPGALAGRFEVDGELPVQGAESDLLLVRDAQGGPPADGAPANEYVVKLYRRGYSADREVWAELPRLTSPHIVRVLETGHADGRDYEIIEYLPDGNLRDLSGRRRVDVTTAVRQLADGLAALHRAGIVHRDLKPENVLVRGAELVITDFGLSKVLEQSVVFASSSRTLAYAAPESLSGQVSPARDWWSLGMIARELATGRRPFDGMSETVVVDHLATRPIDNTDLPDPRVRLLCQGLLTRDPRHRWSFPQVDAWLHGDTPPVHDLPVPTQHRAPHDRPGTAPHDRSSSAPHDRSDSAPYGPPGTAPHDRSDSVPYGRAPLVPDPGAGSGRGPGGPPRTFAEELHAREAAELEQARLELWERREQGRKAGAGRARLRAVLWSLGFLAVWTAGGFAIEALFGGEASNGTAGVGSVQRASEVPFGLLLAAGGLAWAVSCAVEIAVASRLGGEYLLDGPWAAFARAGRLLSGGLSKTSRAMSSTAQRTGARGCGLALVAATIPLIMLLILVSILSSLAWMLWMLVIAIATVGHGIGAGVRTHRWKQAHEARRVRALAN